MDLPTVGELADELELRSRDPEVLDLIRRAAVTEQERRANLAQIPTQIAELREKYVEGGGDPADLA